jgi:hypothetical protein
MSINADSKAPSPGTRPVNVRSPQPAIYNQSKEQEAAGANPGRTIMATIADDDDRLLVRIGYTPVGFNLYELRTQPTLFAGARAAFFKMVDCLLRHIDSRCVGLCSGNIWSSDVIWRARNRSMGLVHRQHHGILHSQFRYDSSNLTHCEVVNASSQLPSWYLHIPQLEECTMSQNMLCPRTMLPPGPGSSVGATSSVKQPELPVWPIPSLR